MLNIQLYLTTDDPNTIGKALTPVQLVQGEFNENEDVDLLNPNIIIGIDPLPNFNYVGFDNRFYFVNEGIKRRVDGTYIVPLKEDVLETWKTEIKNLDAIIERQEHVFNLNIKDPLLKVTNKTTTQMLPFPNGLTREEGIVITI